MFYRTMVLWMDAMRIDNLNIKCPVCKQPPQIKTSELKDLKLIYLECSCTKSAGWGDIYNALSSWIIEIGKKGAFNWIKKVVDNAD